MCQWEVECDFAFSRRNVDGFRDEGDAVSHEGKLAGLNRSSRSPCHSGVGRVVGTLAGLNRSSRSPYHSGVGRVVGTLAIRRQAIDGRRLQQVEILTYGDSPVPVYGDSSAGNFPRAIGPRLSDMQDKLLTRPNINELDGDGSSTLRQCGVRSLDPDTICVKYLGPHFVGDGCCFAGTGVGLLKCVEWKR